MSDNKFEVDQPTEKLLSEGDREEPMKQKLGASQSSDDHPSDGNADSQAKPKSDAGHVDLPSFMPQGFQAGHEAAAASGWTIADAIPNLTYSSLQQKTAVDFSNKFGSLSQATIANNQVGLPATPMDETYQSINSGIQDSNLIQSQFGNVNLPLSAESMQYYEALLGNHNLSAPVLPSDELPFESYQTAEGSNGNTGSNLGTGWSNLNQYNMQDLTAPLGRDFPYQALLNPYENMMLSQDMEGFNMGPSYNPAYNYMEGFPVQGPKLIGMSSQAPRPEVLTPPPPPPPPKVVNNRRTPPTPPPTNAPPQASSSRPIKNSLYDPIFETMGLPVDPHLRMFLARRENGLED